KMTSVSSTYLWTRDWRRFTYRSQQMTAISLCYRYARLAGFFREAGKLIVKLTGCLHLLAGRTLPSAEECSSTFASTISESSTCGPFHSKGKGGIFIPSAIRL